MKRLTTLLTILLATAGTAFAQNFEFQYQGRSLSNGAVVIIEAMLDDFEELACETNPSSDPNNGLVLRLLDATSAEATATMELNDNGFQAMLVQWCMGGNCTIVRLGTPQTKTFTAKSIEQVQFDAYNIQGEGNLEATLYVTIGDVEKSVNILFTTMDPTGIGTIRSDQQPTGEGQCYDLHGRKLPTVRKGINLVRMNDGTFRKILKK